LTPNQKEARAEDAGAAAGACIQCMILCVCVCVCLCLCVCVRMYRANEEQVSKVQEALNAMRSRQTKDKP